MMRLVRRAWAVHQSFRMRDRVLFGAVLFSAVALALVLYRAIVPMVGLRVQTPLPVVALSYGLGRAVVYQLDYCKYIEAPSTVHRELRQVDRPVVIALYSSGLSLPPGCDVVELVEPIPVYVPPGRYTLRVTFTYRVNAVSAPATLETGVFELR